ncbi:MAG: M20/M25/M40 family metallo-hydrolase [Desulfobacterales bacterium]|jgi:tripeptide aminopeptidase|nr:M20/M25/M40 family metallo-hydrolase [Desulfobacterales bacterium]
MIDKERLMSLFTWLVKIDSVSKEEGQIAAVLQEKLAGMGADIMVDKAGEAIGGQSGNIIAKFKGNVDAPVLMLNAHMDTVEPGRGVKPVFKDGVFTSDGTTILGADDKSAIAILLETLLTIQEKNLKHGPLELVLTVCEEVGLLGAKHLDFSLISSKYGFALDASDPRGIITRAPAANRFVMKVYGKDAHAGAAPERGINAILLAGKAIAGVTLGRIDEETTCNIGVIEGGKATNIVPDLVTLHGEVRSHNETKLIATTQTILDAFEKVVADYRGATGSGTLPAFEALVEDDFPLTHITEDHPVVVLAQRAAANLGRTMTCRTTGGGADANIFFSKGIVTGVIGTGMQDMHTVRESVPLDAMVETAELMIEIIRLHAELTN